MDFILSTDLNVNSLQEFALRSCQVKKPVEVIKFGGNWGSLTIAGKPYPGFSPFEDDDYLMLVLGGPLPRYDHSVANGSQKNDGTQWIFTKWIQTKNIRWEDDLVGHFAILMIEKSAGEIKIITDINNFVPIYISKDINNLIQISSHPDVLAITSDELNNIDKVSIGDFLKYLTVTFPFTFYKGIRQLNPASEYQINKKEIVCKPYWSPENEELQDDIDKSARKFRSILISNIKRMSMNQDRVGLLMSGGEDSRVVGSITSDFTKVEGRTITGSLNRETRIASQISGKIGINWQPIVRQEDHYFIHLDSSILLSGSHNEFMHAHLNGISKLFPSNLRVFGGLMADSYFKGYNYQMRFDHTGKFFVRNKINWENRKVFTVIKIPERIDKLIEKRRVEYNHFLRNKFPKKYLTWHWLFPSSNGTAITNLYVNRRLFHSYEPFIDAKLFRLAISIPEKWKINGSFYHKALKPIFKRTKFIFHTSGILPYLDCIPINLLLKVLMQSIWKMEDLLRKVIGLAKKNRQAWPMWGEEVKDQRFIRKADDLLEKCRDKEISEMLSLESRIKNGLPKEKLNTLQIFQWLNWIDKVKLQLNDKNPQD
jgi:asparagine synthetase B (glutamine-hydrolysing)